MAEEGTTRTDVQGAVKAQFRGTSRTDDSQEAAARSRAAPAGDAREVPPEVAAQPQIRLSRAAVDQMLQMIRDEGLEAEGGLRLRARMGAGCSAPLQYGLFLEEAPEPEDTVLSNGDLRIFMDPESAWVLDGLFVDYVDNPVMGEGFAFRHPNGPGGRAC